MILQTGCASCRPEVFGQTSPRSSADHYGVRFGDANKKFKVVLRGRQIHNATEIVVGSWAIRDFDPIEMCGCRSGLPLAMLDEDAYQVVRGE